MQDFLVFLNILSSFTAEMLVSRTMWYMVAEMGHKGWSSLQENIFNSKSEKKFPVETRKINYNLLSRSACAKFSKVDFGLKTLVSCSFMLSK